MYQNHIYKRNEEVPCTIKNYILSTKSYVVESIAEHVIGYLRVPSHPIIKGILRQAQEQKLIVPLRFKCVYEGKLQFYYKLNTSDNNQSESNTQIEEQPSACQPEEEEPLNETESIEVVFSNSNTEYNNQIIQALMACLEDKIDSQEKYDLAVNIISVNKKLKIDRSLHLDIYNKATIKYQTRFWSEGILPYCSNGMVKQAWKNADEDERRSILQRLGIDGDVSIKSDKHGNEANTDGCINNNERQTQQIEQEAAVNAINEKRTHQNNLNKRQQTLIQHSEELNTQRAAIRRQQDTHAADAARRIAQAKTSDERQQIEQESHREDIHYQGQLQQIDEQRSTVSHEIEKVGSEITRTQQEIQIIKTTASVATIGGRGKLKINLKWQTIDDVDLHVYDPDGNHIYFSNKSAVCQGVTGQLDVDANAGTNYTTSPQENIFWNDKAPIGHYKIDVNMYNMRSGVSNVSFIVTIIPELGQAKTFTGTLNCNKQTINLIEFDYTENGIVYK